VCRFLGVRQDIPEILCALDVVVMPSVSEGFPYVLLEALAMKRPVVASHVNGVGEIIATGQEGYLVPPRSPGPLGEAIRRVAAQPREAMERAERGWQRVRGEFSAETFLSRWQELYRELAHPEKR
jgi:glycosyltransferase involved in cell wall biosynthesis